MSEKFWGSLKIPWKKSEIPKNIINKNSKQFENPREKIRNVQKNPRLAQKISERQKKI